MFCKYLQVLAKIHEVFLLWLQYLNLWQRRWQPGIQGLVFQDLHLIVQLCKLGGIIIDV